MIELLKEMPEGAQIRGICTTGYGADLAASVLGTPLSEVETVAHLRAATFLDPKTTYVIDIGGQDMKCLKTHNGVIEQVKLNEACSSGCGAFCEESRGSRYPLHGVYEFPCEAGAEGRRGCR